MTAATDMQPDLFGEWDHQQAAADREARARRRRRAALRLYQIRRRWHPETGEDLGTGHTWCGRCGETTFAYGLVINHDLGYTGCPSSREARRADGKPPSLPMSVEDLCDRWDRQFFPDCVSCGHPWGLHSYLHGGGQDSDLSCETYCRCPGYLDPRNRAGLRARLLELDQERDDEYAAIKARADAGARWGLMPDMHAAKRRSLERRRLVKALPKGVR